jgi:hypothetical protein
VEWVAYGCIAAALLVWLTADVKGLRNKSWGLRAMADIIAAGLLALAVGLLLIWKM